MHNEIQDKTIKGRIIELLGKGYTRVQLIGDFNFAERSVDAAIKEYKASHPDGPDVRQAKNSGDTKAESLPAKAKAGEVIMPEFIAAEMVNIFDGSERDQRIFTAGMSIPLMGLRMFAEGVKPFIDLLTAWQRGQSDAAAATQASYKNIADEAALGVAQAILPVLESLKSAITASAPDPMRSIIANTMQPLFQQAIGGLMRFITQGQSQKQQSSPTGVQPDQAGQVGSQPMPGFQQATENELKEAFND